MELREYVRILRRSWILILVFALVGLGVGAAYALQRAPQYEATSKVFVSPAVATTVLDLDAASGYARSIARDLAELARSGLVLDPVISELDLGTSAQSLAGDVAVSARTNTAIIDIAVTDLDPERAAVIADAIAEELAQVAPGLSPASPDGVLSVRVTIAQQARVPISPEDPRTAFNAGLGALMGLALGLCVAFLVGVLDPRIRGQRDVEQITKSPVLGSIGYDPAAKDQALILRTDPTSPRAEAFRALRTNLHFLGVGSSAHSVVVTAPDEGMGKTTTSANLALALCDADFTVCLVEGDVRRPKVAACFGIPGTVGLTDVIHGDVQLSEALQPGGHERLLVLPAGSTPPNPSELLGSREMTALLRELESQFDVVLIDAAPLLPVTDAAVLAASASGSLVVVAAGRTKRGQLEGALRALEGAGAKTYGVVLTKSPTRGPDANGYGAFERRYGAHCIGELMQPTANGRPRRRFNLRHWLSAAKAKALYALRLDRRLRHWDDERYLRLWYWLRRGRRLRLDPPVSFSEKQQWLKLHDRQPLYTTLVDKYEVKSWVADRVGERYVVPTLGVWDSFDDIDFNSLPESFVLKCTHDSGGLVICRERAQLDLTAARATVQKSLGRSYFYKGREWPYRDVQPRVLAEVFLPTWVPDEAAGTSTAELELLDDPEGVVDFKFYCFLGEPRFLYVSQGLHDHSTARMDFLTLEWKLAPFWRPDYYRFDTIPPKPAGFDEMVSISRQLSAGIPFVRVDLYEHLGRVLFSEMTFSPVSGIMPVSPRRADDDLGRLIDLSLVERRT